MSDAILTVSALSKHFPVNAGLLQRQVGVVRAVDGVSFSIARGSTLALVGESGCGKTTVARCILRAIPPSSGRILFAPEPGRSIDLAGLPERALRPLRRHMQMILQDPYASLNPRLMVGDIVGEPLRLQGTPVAERRRRVSELLEMVGLSASAASSFPHAFSGGQRQRIGIARALALHPCLVVADEPVSALDVSVQAQIINLLLDLQDRLGLSMLFVAHDLSVVKHVSDAVAVMYAGRLVEVAPTRALFAAPMHPYTEALLLAIPKPHPRLRTRPTPPAGKSADPMSPPPGCAFHPRCPYAVARCPETFPVLTPLDGGRFAACHRAGELGLAGVAQRLRDLQQQT